VTTRERVQAWCDAYVEAWRSYEPSAIDDLFTAAATYAYHPYDEPLRGSEAIVSSWVGDRDEPGSWEASYSPLLIEGDRAIVIGETAYTNGRRFSNLWVITFDGDGRCSDFVEWFMEHPR
jgi:SnoaL-like protein